MEGEHEEHFKSLEANPPPQAKRELKIGSMRQGSPKESGKDTVFWKLVRPTTDKCAKSLVHFVGSCSRLARNPYQERYHQVGSALRWGMYCQYKLLRDQRQMAHQSVTENDKVKIFLDSPLLPEELIEEKFYVLNLILSKKLDFFLPTYSQFLGTCSCARIGI